MSRLSDHKILIFDVYGTLADWETGLHDALQPLLSRYSVSRSWTRKEALTAFGSVEKDLQAQHPALLYSELLAKGHEVLEERLAALSTSNPLAGGETGKTLTGRAMPTENVGTSATTSTSSELSGDDDHTTFGASISKWAVFPDSSEALHRLSKHFKLVVLSNVDRESFKYTHALLSEGLAPQDLTEATLDAYTYLDPNPNQFWHPQQSNPTSKSPFSLILTAQDTGCYKPATGGFITALQYLTSQPLLNGNLVLPSDNLEVIKSKVLVVAQSLPHDHEPASQLGIKSVWIDRRGAVTCNEAAGGKDDKKWTWRFETLGGLADAVEQELDS